MLLLLRMMTLRLLLMFPHKTLSPRAETIPPTPIHSPPQQSQTPRTLKRKPPKGMQLSCPLSPQSKSNATYTICIDGVFHVCEAYTSCYGLTLSTHFGVIHFQQGKLYLFKKITMNLYIPRRMYRCNNPPFLCRQIQRGRGFLFP